jgi:hypothetical protein
VLGLQPRKKKLSIVITDRHHQQHAALYRCVAPQTSKTRHIVARHNWALEGSWRDWRH